MTKIPVIRTIAEAYRFTFAGLGTVIGLIWLPVVLLTVGGYFVLIPYYSSMAASLESGDMSQQGPVFARLFVFALVAMVLFAVIAVTITREILDPPKRPVFLRFALGATELRVVGAYFGLGALMVFFLIGVILLGVLIGVVSKAVIGGGASLAASQATLAITGLVGLIGGLALIYTFVRLSFLLVPAATAEGKFGIERSWQLTKGNFWHIILISLATLVPIVLVSVAIDIAILGPDVLNPHFELANDAAGRARHMADQMRQMSAHLPLMMGIRFLLAPISYALMLSPPVFAYRALTAPQTLMQTHTD